MVRLVSYDVRECRWAVIDRERERDHQEERTIEQTTYSSRHKIMSTSESCRMSPFSVRITCTNEVILLLKLDTDSADSTLAASSARVWFSTKSESIKKNIARAASAFTFFKDWIEEGAPSTHVTFDSRA